ncbi:MAG TPA: L-histidine N(alpha)-methyltransferase [Patescibacteria group bacterium]|nr:L-histidine N(alpha)-methyltransferase [Patescibacteria group bacterium]
MKYFKNTELAKLYNVSEKSVRNWISATKQGKLDLQLYEEGERSFIANVSKNVHLIEHLVHKGKKYKNSRGYKVISPAPEFYKLYDAKAVFDILSNLDIYHEIPLQYSYFDGGAAIWDNYVQRLLEEKTPNILKNTIDMLAMNGDYLDSLLSGSERINVIDIGPGNCYPVRQLLQRLVDAGRLNRYICIDISPDMLTIAEQNIRKWFGDAVTFESYTRDITHERFDDLLALDSFSKDTIVGNIVLFLGSTMSNFRESNKPLYTIHDSMGKSDLLIFSKQLDTIKNRRYFDYYTDPEQPGTFLLAPKSKFTLELLNIDSSLYDVELSFDEEHMARQSQVRLKVALSIEFQINGNPKIINFNKGDAILLWRHKHQTMLQTIEQFDASGFGLVGAMTSADGETLLSISRMKRP